MPFSSNSCSVYNRIVFTLLENKVIKNYNCSHSYAYDFFTCLIWNEKNEPFILSKVCLCIVNNTM